MLHTLSKEFSCKSVSLRCRDEERNLFIKSQWIDSTKWFTVYRVIVWLYQLSWSIGYLIYLRVEYPDRLNRIHRFFTSWGDVVYILYYSSALFLCVITARRKKSNLQENKSLINMRSLTWLLHTIAINSSVIVALIFWTLVSSKFNDGKLRNVFNIHRHAISSLVMFMDFCIVATPVRLLHFVYSYLYGLTYTVATLLMYLLGDTPSVYPFLNWEKHPGKAIAVSLVVASVAPTILQIVFYMLYLSKRRLANCGKVGNNNVKNSFRVVTKESSV